MVKKSLILLCVSLFWAATPGFPQEKTTIPCEIMEVSGSFESSSTKLTGIRYILLHHAHSEDRETLSKWLRSYSGTEVTFIVNQKKQKGVLFRLAHCFGRGLLIYTGDVGLEKRDIIDVVLSPPP
jgi:hypothetical protein